MMRILLTGFFMLTFLAVVSVFAQQQEQEQEEKYLKGEDLDKAKITYYDDTVKCEVMKLAEKISQFIDCSDWMLPMKDNMR